MAAAAAAALKLTDLRCLLEVLLPTGCGGTKLLLCLVCRLSHYTDLHGRLLAILCALVQCANALQRKACTTFCPSTPSFILTVTNRPVRITRAGGQYVLLTLLWALVRATVLEQITPE